MSRPQPMSELMHGAARRLAQLNYSGDSGVLPPAYKKNRSRASYRRSNYQNDNSYVFSNKTAQGGYYTPQSVNMSNMNIKKLMVVNNTAYMQGDKLILPSEVVDLIDNKAYMNRHLKLARDYGVDYLKKLAELAQTKAKPSHWYAKVTSTKKWAQTEKMLMELFKKLDKLMEKMQGIEILPHYLPYYLKAQKLLSEYKFNRCIENATARGAENPPHLLAKAIKMSLEELQTAQAIA